MAPPVTVRMYRKLLGDCFLLTLGDPAASREERVHILIDCGVLQNVPGEAALMQAAAADIRSVVGGYLDLLVITHEHWDHISGFSHARDLLIDTLEIRNLWLAWTEKRGDPQADAYRAKGKIAKEAIARVAALTGGRAITNGLEDFYGAEAGKLRGGDIIPELIARATKTGTISYLEPGQVLQTPGPLGLWANVLGPPRNPARLMKDLPSSGDAKETYVAGKFAKTLAARYAMADSLNNALSSQGKGPFEPTFSMTREQVSKGVGTDAKWLKERYSAKREAWRQIDDDWLGGAGALALKVDSDTNNTSLALAFELEAGGDVLLFAADAQVGNWLSWHDQTYPSGGLPDASTARDLLNRTVLYKVGHHASHNATLRGLGLELMVHPGFGAIIPVVEAEARRVKDGKAVHRGWDMPFPDLYNRLLAATQGRLLRGDADAGKDPSGAVICNDSAFLARVTSEELFHELRIV
jgi:hypothetical protein